MNSAILVLMPISDMEQDGMNNEEAFDEILDALREGAYEAHEASADANHVVLVTTRERALTTTLLGGPLDLLPSILLSFNLLPKNAHVDEEAISEAIAILSTPNRGGRAERTRAEQAMAAIIRMHGPVTMGIDRPHHSSTLIRSASRHAYVSILIVPKEDEPMEMDLRGTTADHLPVIVSTSWKWVNGDIMLSLNPMTARIMDEDLPDALEALRIANSLKTEPLMI